MSVTSFLEAVKGKSELELTVKGRRTKKAHSMAVWFCVVGNKIYLLPVNGTETQWYKNVLKDPSIMLTVGKVSIKTKTELITEPDHVQKIVELFAKKYAPTGDINKWYKKLDAAVETVLT